MKIELIAIKVDDNLKSQRDGADKILRKIYGDIAIKKTTSGKPYIDEPDVVFKYFNISHSGNYTVCVFADVPVGVDIEKIRLIDQRVIDRFLDGCPQSDAIRTWTRRESFGKMTGVGFHDKRYEEFPHIFCEYNDINGYIVTVCVSRSGGFIMTDTDFPEYITWYQE